MLRNDLLSVGAENGYYSTEEAQLDLNADQIFAGVESDLHDLEIDADGYDKLLGTAEALEEAVVLDKAGVEAKTITPEYVIAQTKSLEAVLDLGINHPAPDTVGTESIHADPIHAMEVGIEAKEGLIKKIIRKAKDFIKLIIKKIKEFTKKLITSASMLFTNMKSIKDKADELDGGYKFDKKEEKEEHNKFRDALGSHCFGLTSASKALGECISSISDSYGEGSSKAIEDTYTSFKNDKVKAKKSLSAESTKALNKYPAPKGPSGSAIRSLREDNEHVVAVSAFAVPSGLKVVALKLKTVARLETATLKSVGVDIKVDAVTLTGEFKATDIQAVAKNALTAFDNYGAKDVITALYDRLNDIDKDISEFSKTGKTKSVTRIMKFVSFANALANMSIKSVIANQKAAYTAVKVLVDNAE